MRWDNLFADLEGQLTAASAAQFQADVADLTRAERASVAWAGRLAASRGTDITVTLRNEERVAGTVSDTCPQWLLLTAGVRQHLVPLSAVASLAGLGTQSAPIGAVEGRLTLGHALRALSRDRARVLVHTDAGVLSGMIGTVGADHCDVATSVGTASRVTVPFAAILQVRSAD